MACEGGGDDCVGCVTAAAGGSAVALVTAGELSGDAGATEGRGSGPEAGVCVLVGSLGLSMPALSDLIPAPSDLPESTEGLGVSTLAPSGWLPSAMPSDLLASDLTASLVVSLLGVSP